MPERSMSGPRGRRQCQHGRPMPSARSRASSSAWSSAGARAAVFESFEHRRARPAIYPWLAVDHPPSGHERAGQCHSNRHSFEQARGAVTCGYAVVRTIVRSAFLGAGEPATVLASAVYLPTDPLNAFSPPFPQFRPGFDLLQQVRARFRREDTGWPRGHA